MATTPRAGKYLNLEKVRVSEDPKTQTIHLTSKDPDIPGGFHISLNSGTETELKLRSLLEQRDMLGMKGLSTTTTPNYASFYRKPSKNKFFNKIRSIHGIPDNLMSGNSQVVPLGVFKDDSESTWNIADFSNLIFIDEQIVNIVRNHVEYWSNDWSYVDYFDSGVVSEDLLELRPYTAGGNFIEDLLDRQISILGEYGVSSFDEIRDTEKTHKRIMVLGMGAAFDTFNRAVGSFRRTLLFDKKRDQSMALKEFNRLGIHFVLDVCSSLIEVVENVEMNSLLAQDCFPNTQFARVQTHAEASGFSSDFYTALDYLGLNSQSAFLKSIYEI